MAVDNKPAEPIALVDLDGTLADFDGAMKAELEKLRAPGEDPTLDETAYEDVPYVKARRRLIKSQPGFWRNLPRLALGFEVLAEIRELRFRPYVLTKGPAKLPPAWSEKVEWCREHVADLPIVLAEDKGLVYGKVLVDDWPPYIRRWLDWRPRGVVIAVAQPWNLTIETEFANVVRYDGTNIDRVRDRLREIRATAGD
jgi:5'(3')-deoxyribonucleotidase